ncbi:hypothetical protein [Streptomyces sp. MH60]|uniref:hypothetical protein n=1 Tax=Streptomyces sp. MH60 TaxID=1940758 RepID=UPI000D4022DF|nr:hypothetical protein [Streptomyces sp. MH60]PPS86571.1 hypothetical protein BZZ08_03298 [Streptomyces sp. MH60]
MQGAVGNNAVVQTLRQAGHPWARTAHRHGAGSGPRTGQPPVQRSVVQRSPAGGVVQRAPQERVVSAKAHARLAKATEAIQNTKRLGIPNSGNQQRALASTLFNSALRMQVMRNNGFWDLSRVGEVSPSDLTAAKALYAQGGNCGENAAFAFSYLRQYAPGEYLRQASTAGLDHAFVLIGDKNEPDSEWAVADPWPTNSKACLWDEHFAYTQDRSKINVEEERLADGRDTVSTLKDLIKLNPAGEFVAKWDLSRLKGQTVDSLHQALQQGGIAVDPALDKGDAVLKGLQEVAGSDTSKAPGWSPMQLELWCVSQVDRAVLDKVLRAQDAKPDVVNDGINSARAAAGGKYWVWDHADSTRSGAARQHVTGADRRPVAGADHSDTTADADAMDIS